jgi:hypothetical protein
LLGFANVELLREIRRVMPVTALKKRIIKPHSKRMLRLQKALQ